MAAFSLTDALAALAAELCLALDLLSREPANAPSGRMSALSECHRRASALSADTCGELFCAFCPPLERAPCLLLSERLLHAVACAMEVGRYLPPTSHRRPRVSELQGLLRAVEQLKGTVTSLPAWIKGKRAVAPDVARFHAEMTGVRATHALFVAHGDKDTTQAAASRAIEGLITSIEQAYEAALMLLACTV